MKIRRLIAVILAVIMSLGCFGAAVTAAEGNMDKTLKFGDDGKFTVLHVTDIQDVYPMISVAKKFLSDTIDKVKPDLVVLGGDNIAGNCIHTSGTVERAINEYMSIFEAKGVWVAMVFGNHDDENKCSTKYTQLEIYQKYDCFVGCAGYTEEDHVGNYNLPVLSSDGKRTAFNFWLIDSGTYNGENDLDGYACVTKTQIEWYKQQSKALADANGGVPVPSIAFQHIIVPEIFDALKAVDKDTEGAKEKTFAGTGETKYFVLPEGAEGELNETPCPPDYSNGQFDAMKENGDVLAMVFGHDHTNTFNVEHEGVRLINTAGLSFNVTSYNGGNMGMRSFVIDENNPEDFETEVIDYFDIYSEDDRLMSSGFEMCNHNNNYFVRFYWFLVHYTEKFKSSIVRIFTGGC